MGNPPSVSFSIIDPLRNLERPNRGLVRWTIAAFCVTSVHGGVALAVLNWPEPRIEAAELPAAIMIELAPLPVAPDTPPQDVAVGPETVKSDTSTPSEQADKPVENEEPHPDTQKTEPVEKAATETEMPKLEEGPPDAEAVLPVNAAKTEPEPEKKIEEVKPPPTEKKPEPKKPEQKKTAATVAMAPKPIPAAKARTNAAAAAGISSSMSVATWRGMVMAHLNRLKRYPGAGGGTSSVAFTIDRGGRVLSARLIRSSGSAALDSEAVALARRASPVPPPPDNIGKGAITLTVPVRFAR